LFDRKTLNGSLLLPTLGAELPFGIFGYKKFQLGYTLEGPGMENVGIPISGFYTYLVILSSFGIFSRFGMLYQEKYGIPVLPFSL
jgi:hypothetical protein